MNQSYMPGPSLILFMKKDETIREKAHILHLWAHYIEDGKSETHMEVGVAKAICSKALGVKAATPIKTRYEKQVKKKTSIESKRF